MILHLCLLCVLVLSKEKDCPSVKKKRDCNKSKDVCKWDKAQGCIKRPGAVPATKELCAKGSESKKICKKLHPGCTWANLENECQMRVIHDDPRGCFKNNQDPCKPCGIKAFAAVPMNE